VDKNFILAEIKRTAEQNDGVALGRAKFETLTGIKQTDWYGKYWSRWGDALAEAGFTPNTLQAPYEELQLVQPLALLVRELGRFPVEAELRIKARSDKSFPSHSAFAKLGPKGDRARKVLDYCAATPGFDDVAAICRPLADAEPAPRHEPEDDTETPFGYVYLARMGKHYKIGRTASVGRREYELAIQLPEKLTLVHTITTDDPPGIEAYWHNRFADRRGNGEWFTLSAQDVKAFRRRKFM
jgi:hypothetical protein